MIVQNYYTKYILGNTADADVATTWQYMVNDVLTLKYIYMYLWHYVHLSLIISLPARHS